MRQAQSRTESPPPARPPSPQLPPALDRPPLPAPPECPGGVLTALQFDRGVLLRQRKSALVGLAERGEHTGQRVTRHRSSRRRIVNPFVSGPPAREGSGFA
jgi:hypothetical protein